MAEENSNLIYSGNGSPEGVVTAPVNSVYSDLQNAEVYYKTSGDGNTGWELITSLVSLVFRGKKVPEGIQVAPVGSIYVNPRTATVYRKMSKDGVENWETYTELDNNIIAENIAELLTNSVNMTSVFYDIFLNPNPMDVVLWQYNDNNELVPIPIPNRAKDKIIAKEGVGTPEGHVEASVGTAYVDTQNSIVYFKVSGEDQFGWVAVLNREGVLPIISTYCTNRGFVNIDGVRTYLTNNNYVTMEDTASASTLGLVQLDGISINTNGNGAIQAAGVIDANPEVTGTEVLKKIWTGIEDDYSALTPDPGTVYFLTDTGKVLLGEQELVVMAFPPLTNGENDFVDLSGSILPTGSSTGYTAPFNGFFYFEGEAATAAGQYIKVTKSNGQNYTVYASGVGHTINVTVPVLKGEKIIVYYTVPVSNPPTCTFGFYRCHSITFS